MFHRNAGHVLQAQVRSQAQGLAFQEYSPLFPHKQFTMGYAGECCTSIYLCVCDECSIVNNFIF